MGLAALSGSGSNTGAIISSLPSPAPQPNPTVRPTPTPNPTAKPTATPTPSPTPAPTGAGEVTLFSIAVRGSSICGMRPLRQQRTGAGLGTNVGYGSYRSQTGNNFSITNGPAGTLVSSALQLVPANGGHNGWGIDYTARLTTSIRYNLHGVHSEDSTLSSSLTITSPVLP